MSIVLCIVYEEEIYALGWIRTNLLFRTIANFCLGGTWRIKCGEKRTGRVGEKLDGFALVWDLITHSTTESSIVWLLRMREAMSHVHTLRRRQKLPNLLGQIQATRARGKPRIPTTQTYSFVLERRGLAERAESMLFLRSLSEGEDSRLVLFEVKASKRNKKKIYLWHFCFSLTQSLHWDHCATWTLPN